MLADLILIIIIILCIFLGYKKGLIKVAVRFLSFIAALLVALILYTPISNYIIENTEIVPNLKNVIYHKEEKVEEEKEEETNLAKQMENYIANYTEEVKDNTTEFIAEELAIMAVRIGTWIGLFVITKLVMLVLRIFTDALAEIPIIKQFNKARWNNIWCFRRICNNICFACSVKYGITNARRKCDK